MGFLDRLFGRNDAAEPTVPKYRRNGSTPQAGRSEDDIAVERYRYLLRTAPPETIEEVHKEAFTKLTPEQRTLLFTQLSESAPAGEKPANDSPDALAVAATRSEMRQPGTMERSMRAPGMGFGGTMASSMLGTVAGYVIASALVSSFLPDAGADSTDASGADESGSDQGADATDGGSADSGGDFGGGDFGGGGFGDFGGGDF
ncbi:MAG TPA: hypothetical protein VGP24_04565 [Glaciihabitans sp.]|jgi:uncharacterized membrane protein YgcG|nr:hypothetical protein [Glaciihabitans sp.]